MNNYGLNHGLVTREDCFPPQSLTWRDRLISKILGLNKVTQTYKQIDKNGGSRKFLQELLAVLEVTYQCHEKDILSIPASGPVMVVANHPFGAIEGIVLADILSRQRPEIKILAKYSATPGPSPHGMHN